MGASRADPRTHVSASCLRARTCEFWSRNPGLRTHGWRACRNFVTVVFPCSECSVTCIANAFFDFEQSGETSDGFGSTRRTPLLPRCSHKSGEEDEGTMGGRCFVHRLAPFYLCLFKEKEARKRIYIYIYIYAVEYITSRITVWKGFRWKWS